jgi:tetratricopeptide (TPR) repeat protein
MRRLLCCLLALPALSQALDEATFRGDPRKLAGTCADRARLLHPKDSKMLAEYGRAFLAAGERSKAEDCFQLARIESPRDAEVHRLIAAAWLRAGQRSEALKAISDMQLADPKAKQVFTRAAVNLQDGGLTREADALMERAWILDPSEWQNCVAFGRGCLRKARRDVAAKWFARASQAKPQEERMWNAIALAYADHGAEPV